MKFLFAVFLTLSMFTPQRADALVGALVKSPTTKSIGGVMTAGGVGFALIGGRMASDGWVALGNFVGGMMVAGLGLIVLDETQEAEFQFTPIASTVPGFDATEIASYNAEVDELNAIHQTVVSELQRSRKADAKLLWRDYAQTLSPETLRVAASIGQSFMERLE